MVDTWISLAHLWQNGIKIGGEDGADNFSRDKFRHSLIPTARWHRGAQDIPEESPPPFSWLKNVLYYIGIMGSKPPLFTIPSLFFKPRVPVAASDAQVFRGIAIFNTVLLSSNLLHHLIGERDT